MEQLAKSMGIGTHTELFQRAQKLHHMYRRAMSGSGGNSSGGTGGHDLVTAAACLLLSSEQETTDGVLDADVLAVRAGTRSLTPILEAIVACIGETAGLTGLAQACASLGWERLREPLGKLQAHVIATAPGTLRTQLATASPVTVAGLLLATVKALGLPPRLTGIICTRLHANRQQSQRCAELITSLAAPQLAALREDVSLVEHLRTRRIASLKRRELPALSLSDEGELSCSSLHIPTHPQSQSQSQSQHSPRQPSNSADYIRTHAVHELGYTWMISQASPALM